MMELINTYLVPALMTELAGVIAYFVVYLKKKLDKAFNTRDKKEAVKTCVLAGEQLYKAFKGNEKFNKVKEDILSLLNEKNVPITDVELKLLAEEAVAKINLKLKEEE